MPADHTDVNVISARIMSSTKRLHELADKVGSARQVREFSSEMRKAVLSAEVVKALKEGATSATEAEHVARSTENYRHKMDQLAEQYRAAEVTIAKFTAEQASFEAARSLLSFSKESLRQLEG